MPDMIENQITALLEQHTSYDIGMCTWSCRCDVDFHADFESHQAHVSQVLAAELRWHIPSVAFKGPDDTDAGMFRRAAANLDRGYEPGGGNLKAAVSLLLRRAASLLDRASSDELDTRRQLGWENIHG